MPIRVAIVDDHRLVREGLKKVLASEAGIDVVADGASGDDAVRLATDARPDVLLLDIALPDVDGLTALSSILEVAPESRILMLSMHSEPEYAAAALDRGARGLVGKAASQEALVEAIRTVAAGGTLAASRPPSSREREVLALIAEGLSNPEIAERLGIRPKTVEGHCQRLMKKLGIHTRAGLVAHGRRVEGVEAESRD
jgi:DNA-binding NarL/FixJ family response regulator